MKRTITSLFAGIATATCISGVALADCEVWAKEDTSNGRQHRSRVFAWSDLQDRNQLVAEAAGLAQRIADDHNLDFIDVFLTRPSDGQVRADHNAATATVWLRFNPGGTPVIDTRMEADALSDGAKVEALHGFLIGDHIQQTAEQVDQIVADKPDGVSDDCVGE